MMKLRSETPIALLVHVNDAGRSPSGDKPMIEFRITVVTAERINGFLKVRNGDDLRGEGWFQDMQIRAWTYAGDTGFIGGDIEYRDVFAVDRRRAELMAYTLKRLEQRLHKMNEAEGYATNFGTRVNRLARVIGAKRVLTYRNPGPPRGAYDDNDYVEWSPGESVREIDDRIAKFQADRVCAQCHAVMPPFPAYFKNDRPVCSQACAAAEVADGN